MHLPLLLPACHLPACLGFLIQISGEGCAGWKSRLGYLWDRYHTPPHTHRNNGQLNFYLPGNLLCDPRLVSVLHKGKEWTHKCFYGRRYTIQCQTFRHDLHKADRRYSKGWKVFSPTKFQPDDIYRTRIIALDTHYIWKRP